MFNVQDAVGLASWGHRHQTDQSGAPYIGHPLRVLRNVQKQGADLYVQIAAVLHDLTEDQPFTPQILLDLGVPEASVDIVRLVDRNISGSLFHQINKGRDIGCSTDSRYHQKQWYMALGPDGEDEFYYSEIRKNPGALMVKLADIEDNMDEHRLSLLAEGRQNRLKKKYTKARELLLK